MSVPRVIAESPPELVVHDALSRCPYLPRQVARMPLRLPTRRLRPEELDRRLAQGDRRQGYVLYRTECPQCHGCEPLRIPVDLFVLRRSHRRVLRRADRHLRVELARPTLDQQRVDLYNRHRTAQGLGDGQPTIDGDGYRDFLVSTSCDSWELRFLHQDRLVGVSVFDRGRTALSAVYCCFDPSHRQFSIGTYSVLRQILLCRTWRLKYLYLGLYVGACRHLAYKAHFVPHERLIGGQWLPFEVGGSS